MKNKTYDILKYVALIGIPAIVTFLNTLGQTWGIEKINEITATITAIGVLLGALLQISSANYKKKDE